MPAVRRYRLVFLSAVLSAMALPPVSHAQSPAPAFSGICPNGAPAREARYCQFFVRYNAAAGPLPTLLGDFLGITHSSDTRSIGLVIAIDDYPNLPGNNISAAAVDAQKLQEFLLNDQQFDEIIVLRNADASIENINYFLEDYLPNHADDYRGADGQGKGRLLIAYSGHGRPQTPSARAAFILSAATDANGSVGVYKMTDFTADVSSLASHYFHVLTLINACFGANAFPLGNPGAAGTPNQPGSFIITAGSPKDEVQALIPTKGSLFFDLIVNGVRSGKADPSSAQYYMTDGSSTAQSQMSMALSFSLYNYLSGSFFKINTIQKKANPGFLAISPPYFGPVQSGMAQGGFFFFSTKPADPKIASIDPYLKPLAAGADIQTASINRQPASANVAADLAPPAPARPAPLPSVADPASLPLGPISSIKGRPDIKIFKPPAVYPVKGYDFSSADGPIDWTRFAKGPRPRFLYARALGWAGPDRTFVDRWTHAQTLGIDRGVYVKFNFCMTVEQQTARLKTVVPPDAAALPVGIELVTPTIDQPRGAAQLACYKNLGVSQARDRIIGLADALSAVWGKVPILLGNSYNLSILTDARSDRFMIWLNAYGSPASLGERLRLVGRNPWTMWQYSGSLAVAGVGKNTTGEVFFGTADQYDDFRQGGQNVALKAVR